MDNSPHPADQPGTDRPPPSGKLIAAALNALTENGEGRFVPIAGRSMHPFIQAGDQILIARTQFAARRGDVIAFWLGKRLVAHRVMRVRRGPDGVTYTTKGDNVLYLDTPVSAAEVLGRVVAVKRAAQTLNLDAPARRRWGRLWAAATLPPAALFSAALKIKHRLWGPQPYPLTAFAGRVARTLRSLMLRLVGAIAHSWKK
ncbi:MAG: S24/S26 family peptidase [Anaerolineae bacterium]